MFQYSDKKFKMTLNKQKQFSKILCIGLILSSISLSINAGSREQAKRIHDRLAGVPASASVLDLMTTDIDNNDNISAAYKAMEHSAFYSVTLKNFVTPWTNEIQTVFSPLNDYTATVIGIVRDDIDFRKILYDDIIYTGNTSGLPAYSNSNNAHYEAIENQALDLKSILQQSSQSAITGLESSATAGILTTRASAKAFLMDGTNRALFRFTLINHLCGDLEPLKDISRAADRIRQDISRSPGGDSRIFNNSCYGCHAGMDPMIQSFAYYNYNYDAATDPNGESGQLTYNESGAIDPVTNSRVHSKYFNNKANFPYGFITPDDQWDNYWRQGQNNNLGWDTSLPGSGNGAKSMGQELSHSAKFAQCQVEKVFTNVCLRKPSNATDRAQIKNMITSLSNNNFKLKQTFAESAVYCMGE